MIGIVDYGLGNIRAFLTIYQRLNTPATALAAPAQFDDVSHLILPGVGAFDWAMHRLEESGMLMALEHAVTVNRIPVLGVCVGMQIMASRSDEGSVPGLSWIEGDVRKLSHLEGTEGLALPHMGWNDVEAIDNSTLFSGLGNESRFYFLHSYYFSPVDSMSTLAWTRYGDTFASSVHRDNIYGVQFHPEKSHHWGITLLRNFSEL